MGLFLGSKQIACFFNDIMSQFIIPALSKVIISDNTLQSSNDQFLMDENGFYLVLKEEGE